MILLTIFIFYRVGIDSFPDYSNYLVVAENSGLGLSSSDFIFEWFSRFILGFESLSAAHRVAVLAVFNQIVCIVFFVWLGVSKHSDRVFGALFLFCLFGFLFMTTTLRASTAYCCISIFFVRNARFDKIGLALLVFSVAWHDSAILAILVCIMSAILSAFIYHEKINQIFISKIIVSLVIFSGVVIVGAKSLSPIFLSLVNVDLGVRSSYFAMVDEQGLSKLAFLIFVSFCCFQFVRDRRQILVTRIFISLMAISMAILNVGSAIVAVRFSFFILAVILPLRGILLYDFERRPTIRKLSLFISLIVFYLSIVYVQASA